MKTYGFVAGFDRGLRCNKDREEVISLCSKQVERIPSSRSSEQGSAGQPEYPVRVMEPDMPQECYSLL